MITHRPSGVTDDYTTTPTARTRRAYWPASGIVRAERPMSRHALPLADSDTAQRRLK
ncbi:hypothetical protein [Nocardia sp. NBC_01388]|uniref:hypothetical protein n=1 Tax=Nocardia sp. NBC_01388 TaxID=2903596 RepID=UPI00324A71AF